MDSIDRDPDPAAAQAALDDIERAQHAVRDTPWPTWLYPVNAALLGALALTPILGEHRSNALLALSLVVVLVNMSAGYRLGIPWALPTSRGFLAGVAVSTACVVVSLMVGSLTDRSWPCVVLAIAAAACYLAGSVAHRRSTHR